MPVAAFASRGRGGARAGGGAVTPLALVARAGGFIGSAAARGVAARRIGLRRPRIGLAEGLARVDRESGAVAANVRVDDGDAQKMRDPVPCIGERLLRRSHPC
jgi:hypothetical protein